mgnify:CR=1 FL=1
MTYGRIALYSMLVSWGTSALVRSKIKYRPWKYIHYLSYPTLLFALLHVPDVGGSYNYRGIQFFWWMFIVVSILGVVLRARHLIGFGKLSYEVVSNVALTSERWLIRLRPQGKAITVRPGQYIYLQPRLTREEHPFSVLDYNDTSGELVVGYKVFGAFTRKLTKRASGDYVLVDGPYGVFTSELDQEQQEPVFIAGGIGITPFVRRARDSDKALLIYANQTASTAVLRDTLKNALGERMVEVYSHEQGEARPGIEYGFLTADIIRRYVTNPSTRHFYICGPKIMMKIARNTLTGLGVPESQIHMEEFSF